jgi:ribosome biogenesis protein ENP2
LGLANLIGTNVLRAYMHGYFMDIRLFKKAKEIIEPFNYEQYKRSKIKTIIDSERINRVKVTKLPKINKELAQKILDDAKEKKKPKVSSNLLDDQRFSLLFTNADYQIDANSEEYRLLNPVVQKANEKTIKTKVLAENFDQIDDLENETKKYTTSSSSDDDDDEEEDRNVESSDDEEELKKVYKTQYNQMKKKPAVEAKPVKQPKFYEIKNNTNMFSSKKNDILKNEKIKSLPIEMRIKANNNKFKDTVVVQNDSVGNKQMTFINKRVSLLPSSSRFRFGFPNFLFFERPNDKKPKIKSRKCTTWNDELYADRPVQS